MLKAVGAGPTRSRMVIAAWLFAWVLVAGPQAQAPAPSAPSNSLTPGRLALMARSPDQALLFALRRGVISGEPGLRAVAARIVAVARVQDLAPQLITAISAETEDAVVAEMVRALTAIGTPEALAGVNARADRLGPVSAPVFADWLARTSPDQLEQRLPRLAAAAGREGSEALAIAVHRASAATPASAGRLLNAWMRGVPGDRWPEILRGLPIESIDRDRAIVLLESLASERAEIREGTIWQTLSWLLWGGRVPRSLVDAILSPPAGKDPAARTAFESLGRDIVQRAVQRQMTADRSEALRSSARAITRFTPSLNGLSTVLTPGENTALREGLGLAPGGSGEVRVPVPPRDTNVPKGSTLGIAFRTPEVFWPGVLSSILAEAKCVTTESFVAGVVSLTYRDDGRPAASGALPGSLQVGCRDALDALARLTVADPAIQLARGNEDILLLPLQRDFVECTDGAVSSPPVRIAALSAAQGDTVIAPKKVRDVVPSYPLSAQSSKQLGVVLMRAVISRRGCVQALTVAQSAGRTLDFEALKAVSQWRYSPATVRDQPVAVSMTIAVSFSTN
jgi:TonB family protein